jgi:hypothetical protein
MRTKEEIDVEYTSVCTQYGHFRAQTLLQELDFTAKFVQLRAEMAKREEVDAAIAALAPAPPPPPPPAGVADPAQKGSGDGPASPPGPETEG